MYIECKYWFEEKKEATYLDILVLSFFIIHLNIVCITRKHILSTEQPKLLQNQKFRDDEAMGVVYVYKIGGEAKLFFPISNFFKEKKIKNYRRPSNNRTLIILQIHNFFTQKNGQKEVVLRHTGLDSYIIKIFCFVFVQQNMLF